ncbi:MAG: hypothetical protein KBA95_03970 [Acidobacteria bacterium]|nr:hypothetical protein [Acidobacteriota bacterium]
MKRPTCPAARAAVLLAVLALGAAAGCGKKGPPLAPLVRGPVAPEGASASRLGDQVVIQLQVPRANSDGSTPADVSRIEIYGYTGETPDEESIRRDGTLIVTIPVRRPPEEPEEGPAPDPAQPAPGRPPGSMKEGFDQGDTLVVREVLGAAERQVVVPRKKKEEPEPELPESAYSPSAGGWVEMSPPLGPPRLVKDVQRVYMAVALTRRGRRGAFTEPMAVSLQPPPSQPASVAVRYDEKTISVSWEAPPDLRRPTLPPRPNAELLDAKPLGMPSLAGGFNTFVAAPASDAANGSAGQEGAGVVTLGPAPAPLNNAPLPEPRFEEPVPAGAAERCYTVTAISTYSAGPVQSEPSPPVCVALKDVFPPAPPKNLAAVGSEGAVSLIWERSEASDLAGYLVLRSEGRGKPGALNETPIAETTFRDERVKPGVVYRYVVVAVDKAGNRSAPSNAAEESAR